MANVMVVEDREPLRKFYTILLEDEGHTVASTWNGKEALGLYNTMDFDIIVLDLIMPVMDGYEFLVNMWQLGHDPVVLIITAASGVVPFNMPNKIFVLKKGFALDAFRVSVKEAIHAAKTTS